MLREFVIDMENMFSVYKFLDKQAESLRLMMSIVLKAYKFEEKRVFHLMLSVSSKK